MPRIPSSLVPLVRVIKDVVAGWSRHGTERLAASLSFYTLFSVHNPHEMTKARVGLVGDHQLVGVPKK